MGNNDRCGYWFGRGERIEAVELDDKGEKKHKVVGRGADIDRFKKKIGKRFKQNK